MDDVSGDVGNDVRYDVGDDVSNDGDHYCNTLKIF